MLQKEWVSEGVNVASVMKRTTERDTFLGGEMLHQCQGRLRKEWDKERQVVVASLMPHNATRYRYITGSVAKEMR